MTALPRMRPLLVTVTDPDGRRRVAVLPVPESKAINFREAEHPRDRRGRFIEVGGVVALFGGGQGEVTRAVGGGRIEVRRTVGREFDYARAFTTVGDAGPQPLPDLPPPGATT